MDNHQRDNNREIESIIKSINDLKMFQYLDIKLIAHEDGYSSKIGRILKDMKTAQLRRFFGAIKSIERKIEEDSSASAWDQVEAEFYLLKPKIAYAKGRKLIPNEFYQVLQVSLNKVDIGSNEEKIANFKWFVKFLESIVAYHKFYGGN